MVVEIFRTTILFLYGSFIVIKEAKYFPTAQHLKTIGQAMYNRHTSEENTFSYFHNLNILSKMNDLSASRYHLELIYMFKIICFNRQVHVL